MGIPDVPLRELYDEQSLARAGAVRIQYRSSVTAIETGETDVRAIQTAAGSSVADFYVSALPFERLQPLVPGMPIEWAAFEHSPITGIHLWFDRPITSLPHATLSTARFSGCSTKVKAAIFRRW